MSPRTRTLSLLLGGVLIGGTVFAHVRLRHPVTLNPAYWSNPNVSVTIDPAGSDDIPDGSHVTALQNGLDAWNQDTGSNAQLVESTAAAVSCNQLGPGSLNVIWFDEGNCSGYFGGTGTVAITPLWINSNGSITDADVIFNGLDFGFTTSGVSGRFDVQDVGTHELGHLLGLDHSGWAGATMYPYVDQSVVVQRSLSLDDVHGMRDVYPSGAYAQITGTVRRLSDNSVVPGAHVWVRDAGGRPSGGALSMDDGTFAVRGLDAGTYTVLAEPLDQPVAAVNISFYTIVTDFESTEGNAVPVNAGESVAYGDLLVGADVNIRLGSLTNTLPLKSVIGTSQGHVLSGTGLLAGSTLSASDPAVTLSGVTWFSTLVTFTVDVSGGATPGNVDLTATDPSGDVSTLPAAIEIVPPDPTVTVVVPPSISDAGGEAMTITGSGFNPGARVVLGPVVYVDGQPGGCTVVNSTTITLTTRPTPSESYDAVVIDPSGVEGRLPAAVCVVNPLLGLVPTLDNVFPALGAATGGSEIVLTGQDFQGCMIVRIDGAIQPQVQVDGPTQARVTTIGGVAGGPYVLEVENPVGLTASLAFTYSPQPDPKISSLTVTSGSTGGGDKIDVVGSNFTADTEVEFGADPSTGQGGTPAASVVLINGGRLEVSTPSHSGGTVAVMVRDGGTGQASVLTSAFTFQGGGGGGGCHAVPVSGPPGAGRTLLGLFWLGLLVMAVWAYAGLQRRRALARA